MVELIINRSRAQYFIFLWLNILLILFVVIEHQGYWKHYEITLKFTSMIVPSDLVSSGVIIAK